MITVTRSGWMPMGNMTPDRIDPNPLIMRVSFPHDLAQFIGAVFEGEGSAKLNLRLVDENGVQVSPQRPDGDLSCPPSPRFEWMMPVNAVLQAPGTWWAELLLDGEMAGRHELRLQR